MTMHDWKKSVCGKEVAVIGIGVSNTPLIRLLVKAGAKVTAHDKRVAEEIEEFEEFSALGVKLVLGETYLDAIANNVQIVFKTPGIRKDVPALLEAEKNGAQITSEMELFFKLCPCKIFAVTGSDGKTTTTSLIYDMLQRAGYSCYLGGNIGHPLVSDLENMTEKDIAVVELSSFQLHTMEQSANVAVVTNVTPNHLNWHTDYEEYIQAKKVVFLHQKEGEKTVLNYDNEITRSFAKETKNPVFFSRREVLDDGYCLMDNKIVFRKAGVSQREVLDISDIYIPGLHNVENYMAAIAATDAFIQDDIVRITAREFKGVPHRIEFVRELQGVKYYNDSIASSPARTEAGLRTFAGKNVVLIAGGADKKVPFDDFGVIVNEFVKKLVLVGKTKEQIHDAVKCAKNYNGLPIYCCEGFRQAVEKARDIAEQDDIVLLSPACTSFDMFKNFEERGNLFKEIVKSF